MAIFSRTGALSTEGWKKGGRLPTVPLENFWAERFLITDPNDGVAWSLLNKKRDR